MTRIVLAACVIVLVAIGARMVFSTQNQGRADLDAFWVELSRTVVEGDFDSYKATYHEDAVLVSGIAKTSYPIATALAGWEQGFTDTREGRTTANVEFRFTEVLSDATTAHETGIFHYFTEAADGAKTDSYIHFEALLVNNGGWKMMMEYQKSIAAEEEWNHAR